MKASLLAFACLVAACGSDESPSAANNDKCSRVFGRMQPLFEQGGHHVDAATEIQKCRDMLAKNPGRAVWLDCVIAIDGPLNEANLKRCEALDRAAIRSERTDGQTHILGNRSTGSARP